jgi:hypothetical protein
MQKESCSCIKFAPLNSASQKEYFNLMAVAFWDGKVTIYQVQDNILGGKDFKIIFNSFCGGPVLGMAWSLNTKSLVLACGSLGIKKVDLDKLQFVNIGSHSY